MADVAYLVELRDRLIELDESTIEVSDNDAKWIERLLSYHGAWSQKQIDVIESILSRYNV